MRRAAAHSVQRVLLGAQYHTTSQLPKGTKRWTVLALALTALAALLAYHAGTFLLVFFASGSSSAAAAPLLAPLPPPPPPLPPLVQQLEPAPWLPAPPPAPVHPSHLDAAAPPPLQPPPLPPPLPPLPPPPPPPLPLQPAPLQLQAEQRPSLVPLPRARLSASGAPLRAFIFTMDSLDGTVAAAARGGPAGEMRVRSRLEAALGAAGVACDVARSDADMEARLQADGSLPHDLIILDEWTLLAPGGAVRSFVRGREGDVFLLAFFGLRSGALGGGGGGGGGALVLPPTHILTAFPTSLGGTFLGWDAAPQHAPRASQCAPATATRACLAEALAGLPPLPPRKRQGIVWGKKGEYFQGRQEWIGAAGALAPLLSTAPPDAPPLPASVTVLGNLAPAAWGALLAESAFFLGLGDPLLGPSPLDAIAAGAVYINPVFAGQEGGGVRAELAAWGSQHPYLAAAVGPPYVCNAALGNLTQLQACVAGALDLDLPPFVPSDFTPEAYNARVYAIFREKLW